MCLSWYVGVATTVTYLGVLVYGFGTKRFATPVLIIPSSAVSGPPFARLFAVVSFSVALGSIVLCWRAFRFLMSSKRLTNRGLVMKLFSVFSLLFGILGAVLYFMSCTVPLSQAFYTHLCLHITGYVLYALSFLFFDAAACGSRHVTPLAILALDVVMLVMLCFYMFYGAHVISHRIQNRVTIVSISGYLTIGLIFARFPLQEYQMCRPVTVTTRAWRKKRDR